MFLKNVKQYGLGVALVGAAPLAMAETTAGADLSGVVPEFGDVGTQLVAVGAAIGGVLVTFVGVRWVLSMVRRG
jgi:hypothetical protein